MMKQLFSIFIFSSFLILSACSININGTDAEVIEEAINEKQPTNVIFMVGDGMGLTQITSGLIRNGSLNLERMNSIGLSKTSSSDEVVTDSAAGATAFSIGEKSYNGSIGVDKDGVRKETMLETLGNNGFSTGLIATSRITHATPASFYAHQLKRSMGYEIAADMVNAPIDVFVGGGKDHFENRIYEKEGAVDDRSIIKELQADGFTFVNNFAELMKVKGKVGYFIADGSPKKMSEGRGDVLPNSINPVIQHLQKESDKGFFLLVEGSQIDWGGHANDSEYIISEMIDFDNAIGKVLDFAEKDGNTLVVITADHETGGYSLQSKDGDYTELDPAFTTGGHTASMVPVFAFGPGAEKFQGIYNNHEIYAKIMSSVKQ